MSWGSSWGNSGWSSNSSGGGGGSGSSWGSSTWGNNGNNKDPNGTHNPSCIAGSGGWGSGGPMKGYYDERCSGCRHDRSHTAWGTTPSGGNPVAKVTALFGIGYLAKKSLWD